MSELKRFLLQKFDCNVTVTSQTFGEIIQLAITNEKIWCKNISFFSDEFLSPKYHQQNESLFLQ